MKNTTLLLAALAISISSTGQARATVSAAPQHFPKQKTEANLKSWATKYPQEAKAHKENLWQKMTTQNQSTPQEQQEYDQLKAEYNTVSKLVVGSGGIKKASNTK